MYKDDKTNDLLLDHWNYHNILNYIIGQDFLNVLILCDKVYVA